MTEHERHPHDLTIAEAGAALRDGSLTCAALTDSVLQRLEQTEPQLNAYITVTADLAREQAARLDDELREGHDRGPLHGIPIGLKDLVDTAGIVTTGGSGFLRERVPEADAMVWTKLQAAGRGAAGQAQSARVRVRHDQPQPALRAGLQPVGHRAVAGRIKRRKRRGGGGRLGARRDRQRHGREHPDSGVAVWDCRADGDVRPCVAGRGAAALVDARPRGAADADRGGRGAVSRCDRGLRPERSGLGRPAGR